MQRYFESSADIEGIQFNKVIRLSCHPVGIYTKLLHLSFERFGFRSLRDDKLNGKILYYIKTKKAHHFWCAFRL